MNPVTVHSLPSMFQMLINLYAYFLPVLLCVVWAGLGLADLSRRQTSLRFSVAWVALILLLPFLGAIAYQVFGSPSTVRRDRVIVFGSGVVLYLLVLFVGHMAGGVT
jgi:hypothetical protein